MKYAAMIGMVLWTGGCAGVRAELNWPDADLRNPEDSPSISETDRIGFEAQESAKPAFERPRRFKSEDEAMRFENSPPPPIPSVSGAPEPGSPLPPLPRSLSDPWRTFTSPNPPSSTLLWSRGIPGVTERGFFGSSSDGLK